MQVKGTALKTTRDFVKTRFPGLYDKWIESLPAGSQALFTAALDASAWYSYREGYAIPISKIMELCFNNDRKSGGEQLGSYSAETALTGFYKVFLLIASPQFLMQRASKIFTTFYTPSEIEAEIPGSNNAILRITRFEEIDESVEYRIAGWAKKALELTNCRNPDYTIKKSLTTGDSCTEILFTWQ